MELFEVFLLGLLIVCGIPACVSRNMLVSLIIYMAYSLSLIHI